LPANTEVPRVSETPLYVKKEQRINDRLHDKINVLKAQAHSQENIKQVGQIGDSKIMKDTSATSFARRPKEGETTRK
jgi:hypothetical protein